MKRVFEKVKPDSRIIIGYSTSLFLLLVVYVVTLVANNKLKEKTKLVEHTYQVKLDLESLLSRIKDAETGVRGFAITKNSDFLEPYYHSQENVDSLYKILWNASYDNPVQRMHLAELKDSYDKRFIVFERYLAYIRNGQIDTAYKIIDQQLIAKRIMNNIRRVVNMMQKEETKLLEERDKNQKATFASINTITITSLLLTLVLVIIGFVSYTSESRARKTALQNIKDYQQQLSNRIDELNNVNAQLMQMRSMEKFAATGRIARTIAHEVRNPLTNIDLASSQLKADLDSKDENLSYYFDVIDRNSTRINKLISDLLQTTKFSELNFSSISVNNLIDDTLALAKDRIELNQVQLTKEYKDDIVINVDADKMKIAFLNIIINAVEAMQPGKGKLKIVTKKEEGNCVVIISDNGSGMDETSLSKLFEPYFTNKQNGNGLGLANTQNVIFNHKGNITVSSKPGEGSSFKITLPAS
ncbi:MAG: CHASE3 domain-containing protein [Bacteroidota bacterium]